MPLCSTTFVYDCIPTNVHGIVHWISWWTKWSDPQGTTNSFFNVMMNVLKDHSILVVWWSQWVPWVSNHAICATVSKHLKGHLGVWDPATDTVLPQIREWYGYGCVSGALSKCRLQSFVSFYFLHPSVTKCFKAPIIGRWRFYICQSKEEQILSAEIAFLSISFPFSPKIRKRNQNRKSCHW